MHRDKVKASGFSAHLHGTAENRRKLWDKNYPNNKFDIDDLGFSSFRKWLERKAKNIATQKYDEGTKEFREEFRRQREKYKKEYENVSIRRAG